MSILPIEGPSPVLQAAAVAKTAASATTSVFASMLKAAGVGKTPASSTGGNLSPVDSPANASQLTSQIEQLTKSFHAELKRVLGEEGIKLSSPLVIKSDPLGSLRLAGEHPQRLEIEGALASSAELEALFSQLEASSRQLEELHPSSPAKNGAPAAVAGDSQFLLLADASQATGRFVPAVAAL